MEHPQISMNHKKLMSRDLSNFNEWASDVVRFRDSETVKTVLSVDHIGHVLEDICAFANSGKGTMYFGIDESGFVVGDTAHIKKPRKLMTAIFLHISPPLFPRITVKKIDGRDVVCAEIIQASDKPYFLDGKYFKRMGSSNVSLFPHEIKIFMHSSKLVEHFDSKAHTGYHGGINQAQFDGYLSKADFGDIYSNDQQFDEHEIMQKLGLLSHNKINTAAILCFGIGIDEWFPQAHIICQRIEGIDETGKVVGSEKIGGNLFNQYILVNEFLTRNLVQTSRPGENWAEKKQVITMLISELIRDAIIHREYAMQDPIAVLIFNDHTELIIPGNLSRWYSQKTTGSEGNPVPSNPLLAKLFYLSGELSNWLPRINHYDELLEEYNLPVLELFDHTEYIGIILRWERERTGTIMNNRGEEEAPSVYGVSREPAPVQSPASQGKGSYWPAILNFCRNPKTRSEIQDYIYIKDRKHFRQTILWPILRQKLIAMTIPGKPNSPRQKYKTTARGVQWLNDHPA